MAKKKEEAVEAEIVNEEVKTTRTAKRNDGRLFLGLVFLLVGVLIFHNNFFPGFEIGKYFWPVVFIIFGLSLVSKSV